MGSNSEEYPILHDGLIQVIRRLHMRHFAQVLGFGALLAILVAVTSSDVNADKKKNKDKQKDAKEYPVCH